MKNNLKILAVIFSVVLNIVFIGSYFYHISALLSLVNRQADHKHLLYEELNLNQEQLHRLKPLRDSFHAFVAEQGGRIKSKQLELIDLLSGEHIDRSAINTKQEEIQVLQRQMKVKVIDHLIEESKMFTPEQRQKFFSLLRERIEKSDGPRPRWMPRTCVNPSTGERP